MSGPDLSNADTLRWSSDRHNHTVHQLSYNTNHRYRSWDVRAGGDKPSYAAQMLHAIDREARKPEVQGLFQVLPVTNTTVNPSTKFNSPSTLTPSNSIRSD